MLTTSRLRFCIRVIVQGQGQINKISPLPVFAFHYSTSRSRLLNIKNNFFPIVNAFWMVSNVCKNSRNFISDCTQRFLALVTMTVKLTETRV